MKKFLVALVLLAVSLTPVFGQSGIAVKQSGNITPNQVPWWITSGVIGSGVTAADSPISSFGATGPICSNSARIVSGAWQALCIQSNTNSSATLSLQSYGTATAQSLCFVVNGVSVCLSSASSGGIVTTSLPTTTGAVTCWANTVGTLGNCSAGAATLFGNPGVASGIPAPFTIQGLPARGAPDANNDKIPIYDNASGTIKYVTPGLVAASATAGVSSIDSQTGPFSVGNGIVTTSGPTLALSAGPTTQPIICNGEVIVDQRKEGNPYTSTTNEVYGPDCHRFVGAGGTPGVFTLQRIEGAGPAGFQYSLQANVLTPNTAPAHDDNYHWEQPLEDIQVRALQFGTANAQTFTYQWWQSCNNNAVYSVSFSSSTNTRSYVQTVNYTGSNAFQHFSITVPGDTYAIGSPAPWTYSPVPGAYVPANHIGLKIMHDFGWGSDHTTSNTGVWQSGGFFKATGSFSFIQSAAATCYFTGMQIDLGSQALTFRYTPANLQLAYMQRFIRKTIRPGVAVGDNSGRAGAVGYVSKTAALTTGDGVYIDFSQNPMVAPPILTFYNPIGGTAGFWQNISANTTSGAPLTTIGATTIAETGFFVVNPQVAGDTTGQYMAIHYLAGACLGNAGSGTGC